MSELSKMFRCKMTLESFTFPFEKKELKTLFHVKPVVKTKFPLQLNVLKPMDYICEDRSPATEIVSIETERK